MADFLKNRIKREIAARQEAERILEEKSLELYFKNIELEDLNKELNKSLTVTTDELDDLENIHLELFENSAVGIVMTEKDIIVQINKAFADLLGYEKAELIGKHIKDISYRDDVNLSMQNTKDLSDKKIERFSMQKRYKRKNGTFFWGSTNVSEVKGKKGKEKCNLAVIVNIHNEKIAENKLHQTVSQLQEINQNLENFAHIVSHDLKAPLTGINTVLAWIEETETGEEMRNYTSLMKERVEKMYTLIEGIISYSKVSNHNEERSLVDVEEVVDEAIQFLQVPMHIEVVKEGVFPKIYINRAKFMQVFNNLIDNAIRHNDKEKGLIKIAVTEDNSYYYFSIHDNGEGIEERYFIKIFEIFNTLTKTGKNTGIGLSLVKKIVEQCGGKVSVKSKRGMYTEFRFTISKQICDNND
ncbi:MAG: hypothetical protein BM557_09920 [Flavobacterium sp. MedPE-SWcel]|uniref:sensor histidine kinase n=1 Tax=uncultured Flavobacterium sp. TaxID=165435 RepID=UPI000911F94D|nr:PAS domain-containing sensor histidine kinase [uncultured Flavobacterium sp.]OIQ16619.1 MAG: hypothetical protein BM557_09920 [Flavobacterium sp. MedPE-SWcel]